MQKLNTFLPSAWSKGNPIDILGDADAEKYKQAVEICLDDINVDGVLVILTPQDMTDPVNVAKALVNLPNKNKKTLLASWMGGKRVERGRRILESGNIPTFRTPETAVWSFLKMYSYSRNLKLLYEIPATIPHAFKPKTLSNKKLIKKIIKENLRFLILGTLI